MGQTPVTQAQARSASNRPIKDVLASLNPQMEPDRLASHLQLNRRTGIIADYGNSYVDVTTIISASGDYLGGHFGEMGDQRLARNIGKIREIIRTFPTYGEYLEHYIRNSFPQAEETERVAAIAEMNSTPEAQRLNEIAMTVRALYQTEGRIDLIKFHHLWADSLAYTNDYSPDEIAARKTMEYPTAEKLMHAMDKTSVSV